MVGKLIKHELRSILRIATIPAIIMIMLAVVARIMLATFNIGLAVVIILFYFFSVMATLFIGYFFGVSSFYQSLFTGNGYLTLSLPVTPDQLIWAKLISAITVMFASIILCVLSVCIFFLGIDKEVLGIIYNMFSFFSDPIIEYMKSEPLYCFELVLSTIISIPMTFLVFYAVMCLGQMITVKNRKFITILLYIGIMFVWSILNTTIISDINEKMTEISIHLTMWVQIVFYAAVNIGCYFFVRYIIKSKINLLA